MGLLIPSAAAFASMILSGDRLERVRLESDNVVIYQGNAIVRRVSEQGADLFIGVELDSRGVDLRELYRQGSRLAFSARLDDLEQTIRRDGVSIEFKAWVAEFGTYLGEMKHFMDREETFLNGLDLMTRDETISQYVDEAVSRVVEQTDAARRQLNTLVCDLDTDSHIPYRAFSRRQLMPFLLQAPFIRRAFEKPLGYAGDYEMMNMLYRPHSEGQSLFSKVLNVCACREPVSQANINRIPYLENIIRTSMLKTSGRLKIASVGSGPAHELVVLLSRNPELGARLDIALIDQEPSAITFCERTLGPIALQTNTRVHFIRESIRTLLTTQHLASALGMRNLIYSAGLFDYLSDRTSRVLMNALYGALEPDGLMVVGNVSVENPSRWVMEYHLDWFLLHRSSEDLIALASSLEPKPSDLSVDSEPLGVNLFLLVSR